MNIETASSGTWPRSGEQIEIHAFRSDGLVYRWWDAIVEAVDAECIITLSPAGGPVHGPRGGWIWRHAVRAFYWFNRSYNLMEVYRSVDDHDLYEIYVHIASPATLENGRVVYTDHELDVTMYPGHPPRLVDEDEFAAASLEFNYTPEFQAQCYQAAQEALELVASWQATPSLSTLALLRVPRQGKPGEGASATPR